MTTRSRVHTVLCGDSVFDNQLYVSQGEPDVAAQLRACLGDGSRVTLLAVDGDVTTDVRGRLHGGMPDDASHIFVSSGGNDALGNVDLLYRPASSVSEVLDRFASVAGKFEDAYTAMLESVLEYRLPTGVCTIYYPRFDASDLSRLEELGIAAMEADERARLQRNASTALSLFNDVILRLASRAGLPVLDLRLICDEDSDYANPIEPSARGGEKIAERIVSVLREHDFALKRSTIFV